MINVYLEKIAADEKKKSHWHPGAAIGSALVGNIAAGTLGAAQIPVAHKVMSKIRTPSDSGADMGTIKKFMRDNELHKTTTFNTRHHANNANFGSEPTGWKGKLHESFKSMANTHGMGTGPAYLHTRPFGAKKNVIVGKGFGDASKKLNPDVIMHELGHAKDYASHGAAKMALRGVSRLAPVATLGALSNDKTRDYAPAIAAIPGLATLRDEAAANFHAYRGIKAHKGVGAANKFVRKLLPAQMGSYAIGAAVPVAGAYIAKKILDKVRPKEGK